MTRKMALWSNPHLSSNSPPTGLLQIDFYKESLYSVHRDHWGSHSNIEMHISYGPNLHSGIRKRERNNFCLLFSSPYCSLYLAKKKLRPRKTKWLLEVTQLFCDRTKMRGILYGIVLFFSFFQSNSVECRLLIMLKWQVWFLCISHGFFPPSTKLPKTHKRAQKCLEG